LLKGGLPDPKGKPPVGGDTARSVEDETRNAELNGNRNPKCWGYFKSTCQNRENQISRYLTVQSRIEILIGFEFRGISRYKFKLRFLLI